MKNDRSVNSDQTGCMLYVRPDEGWKSPTSTKDGNMIINRQTLLKYAPIKNMMETKEKSFGYSHGMSEAGYDIRIKQEIRFGGHYRQTQMIMGHTVDGANWKKGNFTIASAIEEFEMPINMVGVVHDKSTWGRQGLSVLNTVIEPGWKGFLTLELVYHGQETLHIPAGVGIAQVVFHQTSDIAEYSGKYQHQEDKPQEAKHD